MPIAVGKIPVLIDFVNICANDEATILAAIFKGLLGILIRPAAFLSFSISDSLGTTFSVEAFVGKVVFWLSQKVQLLFVPYFVTSVLTVASVIVGEPTELKHISTKY